MSQGLIFINDFVSLDRSAPESRWKCENEEDVDGTLDDDCVMQ